VTSPVVLFGARLSASSMSACARAYARVRICLRVTVHTKGRQRQSARLREGKRARWTGDEGGRRGFRLARQSASPEAGGGRRVNEGEGEWDTGVRIAKGSDGEPE